MMGALEFPQEARAAHRNRSRTTCAGLRYCGLGRTRTHTQRRRRIKPYAVAALLYILFARTHSTDTHAYARRQALQRTIMRWERRNMLTHGSLIPHSLSPHMYIMLDSRSLPFEICFVIKSFQPSWYVSATCSLRCTIAFAGSRPLGQHAVQFMMPWQR